MRRSFEGILLTTIFCSYFPMLISYFYFESNTPGINAEESLLMSRIRNLEETDQKIVDLRSEIRELQGKNIDMNLLGVEHTVKFECVDF